jgi:serine/threonine protein kinase, bacterial
LAGQATTRERIVRPVGSKYATEEPLGRGATGTVWRSKVRETGETVAIKVLKEELASDPDIVMRFLRERSVLVRLRHPHIVRVRDLVVEGDLLALVMDLVDGPDLQRYLRENGPFSPVGTALLTAAVADALAASHADGIVHRDLKPANVMLATADGADGGQQMHPLLTDFGIARLADSPRVTRTHEFVGTLAYVAPESAQGQPQTSAVDIYAAGVLLYELVTGRPPFLGENALEVLHAHLNQEPRRPSTVPEPLWTVIERCLRKKPQERPSAENLARALRVVAAGVGVHATPDAAEAALGVAALLAPDPDPVTVPGTGQPDAAATQVLPNRPTYDPSAATSVLPSSGFGADPAQGLAAGPGEGGLGQGGGDDGTLAMPAIAEGQPEGAPQGPHPWESQLGAARQRAAQTEVQYLDPSQDPLRHRPRRRPAPQQPPAGYQQQPPSPYQQPQRPPYEQPSPQRYEPRRAPAPEPAPPREPRRRNPNRMRIPGLGCLKGCLTMILVLVVIAILVWNLTPLPEWVAQGKSFWDTAVTWVNDVWNWVSAIGDQVGAGSGPGAGGPGPGGPGSL